ncbi:uncharacterized protein C5orf47 homolog isoform X2 [Monodelphis domestica]|uniref:uncharacterized protein C5orf47 homolog isoform X2 n=1 Tax=Monodelphis domestica TaxID=13616 RepID=UPI0004432DE1|nr:uncharacterized protein C5orf47 homolog isoform X2 [Monodelphis domestica]
MDSTASSPTPSILSPSCPPTPPKPFLCFLPISPGGCACGGASGEVGAEMASPSWGPRPLPRCVYANCFGSHPCGRSIFYEGLGLWRLQRHEAGKESQEVEAVMAATVPGGSSEPTQPKAERLPAPNLGKQTLKAHRPPQRLDQVARRRQGKALRAGDRARKENVSDTFEFYVPLNEAGKITKKKKKMVTWPKVQKMSPFLSLGETTRHEMID